MADRAKAAYIFFELDEVATAGRRTSVWKVKATRDYTLLGVIKWFGRWRQYALFPEPETVFNPDCLDLVSEKIRALMAARKETA